MRAANNKPVHEREKKRRVATFDPVNKRRQAHRDFDQNSAVMPTKAQKKGHAAAVKQAQGPVGGILGVGASQQRSNASCALESVDGQLAAVLRGHEHERCEEPELRGKIVPDCSSFSPVSQLF